MAKNNNTLQYRLKELENNYKELDKKIDSLLTNHLPSLEKQLLSLRTEVRTWTVLNVGAIIVGLLIAKFL